MTTVLEGVPLGLPAFSMVLTSSMPESTVPKTTCLPSSLRGARGGEGRGRGGGSRDQGQGNGGRAGQGQGREGQGRAGKGQGGAGWAGDSPGGLDGGDEELAALSVGPGCRREGGRG